MEIDEVRRVLPFQLQFDKPVPSQIKIAEWNPEKDLLAMVTEDSKIVLHRFNWQRLWMITPGRCTTSLCWRPDGKAIAIGLEDGTVSLHDVENGKLLRSIKSHNAAVVCLNWEEGGQQIGTELGSTSSYEDRTSRFFPPAPRVPRMPGLIPGDAGFTDDCEDSFRELSNSSYQHFNVLCSGDEEGSICFSIFGIFPIGKINIHNFCISTQHEDQARVQNASISKVIISEDLCHLTVICRGELVQDKAEPIDKRMITDALFGLHCLVLDTSIFWKRKHELHQVAVQASNIEDLTEVIRASLSIMCKQWSDAMHAFHEKFSCLSALISDHGLDSSPQEEFLSLLGGARTSPPVHQFLVSSLGEVGIKRVSKVVYNAGRELQLIILDHLQPAAEIIGFRMGELRGFSRWRARYQSIGLDEALINDATEKAGLFLVQVERFMGVLSSVVQQFSNFFNWLIKCTKLLMSEAGDHLPPFSSELVVIFLKFLYDQDPVKQLLDPSEVDCRIEVDMETMQRVRELVLFGGFRDSDYLKRTLAKEFQQMEFSFKEAFLMPFTTVKEKMVCKDLLPLFPLPLSLASAPGNILTSVSYYKDNSQAGAANGTSQHKFIDYISFKIPDEPFPDFKNCICVLRGFVHGLSIMNKGSTSLEAVVLRVPNNYHCVDLSLYKESQLVLLLNEIRTGPDSTGNACMMITQASEFPFVSVSSAIGQSHFWILHGIKDTSIYVQMENEKVRSIPHLVIAPLAVSASRGVVCVFAAKKRALVYILDEDEEEEEEEDTSDME